MPTNHENHEKHEPMTTTQIEIIPAHESYTRYTHASLDVSEATSLARAISELDEAGHKVLFATAARSSVPTSYRSAYKMHAPHWVYDGEVIHAVNSKLENRSRGASIPQHFEIAGNTIPDGFRCFKRSQDSVLIRRK